MRQDNCIQIQRSTIVLGIAASILTTSIISLVLYRRAETAVRDANRSKTQMSMILNKLEGLDESLSKISQYSGEIKSIAGEENQRLVTI